jgi:hypothetical protein
MAKKTTKKETTATKVGLADNQPQPFDPFAMGETTKTTKKPTHPTTIVPQDIADHISAVLVEKAAAKTHAAAADAHAGVVREYALTTVFPPVLSKNKSESQRLQGHGDESVLAILTDKPIKVKDEDYAELCAAFGKVTTDSSIVYGKITVGERVTEDSAFQKRIALALNAAGFTPDEMREIFIVERHSQKGVVENIGTLCGDDADKRNLLLSLCIQKMTIK